jgi:methionine sulfoxide reductase heme-binding subunit
MLRVTDATGYLATGLLGLTLLIGPANLLLRKRIPISNYLRRDVGAWTAIFSVVHVIFGLEMHSGGQISFMLRYFVMDGRPLTNSFGLANWTGLAALVIVVVLLALSTDGALRELKARTWKDLQRLNYTLFALVILHVFFYGALLRMTSPFTLLGILTVIAVVVGQAVGVWLWRRRHSHRGGTLAQRPASQSERQPAGTTR